MGLDGVHHVTAITADAQGNIDFYAGVLGLRLVKRTVNFDAPDVYHLYYGSEIGDPGSLLTFFEFPGAASGRPGAGMVHRIRWRVAGEESLGFWTQRLLEAGCDPVAGEHTLRFSDPEGLEHELVAAPTPDAPLTARSPAIPPEHRILGIDGVRAYASSPAAGVPLLTERLGFDSSLVTHGPHRRGSIGYDEPPASLGVQGAGSVHHVAWAVQDDSELLAVRGAAHEGGAHTTEVIDRTYFHSVYFREPSGVLFELATLPPGFAVDEPVETLGEHLCLPPRYEPMRERLELELRPLELPPR
jgi:glyoxalase family protein